MQQVVTNVEPMNMSSGWAGLSDSGLSVHQQASCSLQHLQGKLKVATKPPL